MVKINGYTIKEQIYNSANSTVFRGIKKLDNQKVIIKFFNREYPSISELAGIKKEYSLTNKPYGENVIKALALEHIHNTLAIILEDFGGSALSEILKNKKFLLADKILLAINITNALNQIHKQNIIHKDINPSNIILNLETKQLKIIDFGISSELNNEKAYYLSFIEGTIPYISPEQTGKMNRIIDYRSDLYSLGITFYEIFTDKLPFNGDNLEIVHSHIAKEPIEPKIINNEIPQVISNIIMKLLAKNAEDRYQSLLGLKSDLEYCLKNLRSIEQISRYDIGQNDISGRFLIPQKLYSREKEIETLISAYNWISTAEGNQAGLILVSGYSGIGKTSIIREINKVFIHKGYNFISGKFEQLERNNPYSALISAFKTLIHSIINETKNIELWKERITTKLGINGKIITDLIPELELIIGKQAEITQLNPSEEKNRFQLVFHDFIHVFVKAATPFIIFLDDLQWCDLSTIDLLKHILFSAEMKNLLIIGAYRDNEVKKGHPLLLMLEEVKNNIKNTDFLFQIFLEPLNEQTINQMIADTLNHHYAETSLLTNCLYQKTKGNPFFTKKMLTSLYEKNIIKFDDEKCEWKWDMKAIEDAQISDNVIDFLVEHLNLLPVNSLEILKLASCIGNYFDLRMIYSINKRIDNVIDAIISAVKKEFIIPLNNIYQFINLEKDQYLESKIDIKFRFNHDRIQQAAYSLIPDNEKAEIHRNIGQLLLYQYEKNNLSDGNIFELTNHLNRARYIIHEKEERIKLANLNYKSGRIAKSNSAYDIAKNYFIIGKSLLSEDEWKDLPDKYFDLSIEYIESVFLAGESDNAIDMCSELYKLSEDKIEKIRIHQLKAKIYDYKFDRNIIFDEVRTGLKLFDIELPSEIKVIEQKLEEGIGKMQEYLSKNSVEELIKLPKMQDIQKIMAMNLLFLATPAAYQTCPPLFALIQLIMFDMAIQYGTTEVSCINFVDCGVIQGSILGNYSFGYNFSKVGFHLINKYKADAFKPSSYFVFAAFISHWKAHYKESLEYFDLSIKTGMETGDLQHASYSYTHKIHRYIYIGKNLNDCRIESENCKKFLTDHKSILLLLFTEIFPHIFNQLQSNYNYEQEQYLLHKITESQNLFFFYIFGEFNLMVNYILDNMEAAEKWCLFSEPYLPGGMGTFFLPDHYMFESLLLLKKYNKASKSIQDEILDKINKNLTVLKNWADNCPVNFAHKYFIVIAELSRINNEPLETITNNYKKALESIQPGEFIHIKAIFNELIGEFWLDREMEIIGKAYIKEAYYFYSQWGAFAKISYLQNKYPQIFTNYKYNTHFYKNQKSTGTLSIDFITILKSTQAISSEIRVDKLLKVFMNTIIENAGAQKGCIILKNNSDDKLYVEAIKKIDSDDIHVLNSIPLNQCNEFCREIVDKVIKTRDDIIIDNAYLNAEYETNEYIKNNIIKSILCVAIVYQNRFKGIIYLENNLAGNVFNIESIEIIKILTSQISISIENAQLYENLESIVNERTKQLEKANMELKELSLHDPLTKLHNRRYMYEYISIMSENFIKSKTVIFYNRQKRDLSVGENVLGVFLIDLDFFKKINDTYGHAAGDDVLIQITKTIKNLIRKDDFIIRWGGEEFLVILNKTKLEYLEIFSKKVLKKIKETPIELSKNKIINVTCSIGCTYLPFELNLSELLTLEQTINISDFALYKAKENGRDCAVHISLNDENINNTNREDLKNCLINISKDNVCNSKFIILKFLSNFQ